MRIGIDVGGTNTDAVLLDGGRVVSWHKTETTPDVGSGIVSALRAVLTASRVDSGLIESVMIGTTHFTNAVLERKRLLPAAALRLALPANQALPPMVDWPPDLRDVLGNHIYLAHGGYDFNGKEISSLDEQELLNAAADMRKKQLRSVAITSVFSPVNADMEKRAAEILQVELPDAYVTLSSEIGRIGLLERENAAIMNASLRELAATVIASFDRALGELKIEAPVYISQNDGTLMSSDYAERYPVLTFASGPTNSMRGAALLSNVKDGVVVDVGGTTSDVGFLSGGFPREAASEVEIAAVRTNFRMPDIISIGLGGGSIVRPQEGPSIGPDSVGYELKRRALVFGGDTLTATDIAVAAGLAELGDRGRAAEVDSETVSAALAEITRLIERAVDKIKTSADLCPVVLVGGGTILVGDDLAGASELVKPEHAQVANAIGAAIAQVGGEIDRVFSLETASRADVLEAAQLEATAKAIEAGAEPESIAIVDVEDIPLTYLPGNEIRVRVKAVGDLARSAA
jgi:N-methylhydantoinase A/oxoprolinase/acetone carboxylase beta subunit